MQAPSSPAVKYFLKDVYALCRLFLLFVTVNFGASSLCLFQQPSLKSSNNICPDAVETTSVYFLLFRMTLFLEVYFSVGLD